jgi:hypothetical protein
MEPEEIVALVTALFVIARLGVKFTKTDADDKFVARIWKSVQRFIG